MKRASIAATWTVCLWVGLVVAVNGGGLLAVPMALLPLALVAKPSGSKVEPAKPRDTWGRWS